MVDNEPKISQQGGGPPAPKKIRKSYTQNELEKALAGYRDGKFKSIREAGKAFGIPHTTLCDKLHGVTPMSCSMGPKPKLEKVACEAGRDINIEDLLKVHCVNQSRRGFPLQQANLTNLVKRLLETEGLHNPFPNETPGRSWFRAFLRRHPDLSQKSPEHHSLARAAVTEPAMRAWFCKILTYAREANLLGELGIAERMLNGDETPFTICQITGKFIGVRGESLQYTDSNGGDKESFTVMVTASASGELIAPTLILKYQRIPAKVLETCPEGWTYLRSDSGWMTGATMLEYGKALHRALVDKGLLNEEGDGQKVFLFLDGYSAHLDVEFSQFCESHGIVLICLMANATHVLQPVDVGINAPLKHYWARELQKHKLSTGERITKYTIGPKLSDAFKSVTPQTIKNAFRKCGIYPFDPDAVDYTKLISYHVAAESADSLTLGQENNIDRLKAAVQLIEDRISQDDLKVMQRCYDMDLLPSGDALKGLYSVWHGLRKDLDNAFCPVPPMGVPIIEGLTSKVPDGNHDDGDQISEMAIDFETEYFGDEREDPDEIQLPSFEWTSMRNDESHYQHDANTNTGEISASESAGVANKSVVNAETQDMVEHDLIVENIPPSVVDETEHAGPHDGVSSMNISKSVSSMAETSLDTTSSMEDVSEIADALFGKMVVRPVFSNLTNITKQQTSAQTDRGRAYLSPISIELLKPTEPKTAKRPYKKRANLYVLSSQEHRDQKTQQAKALQQKKAKTKSALKSNVDFGLDMDRACRICEITPKEDEISAASAKKRSIPWAICCVCSASMHVKCVPKKIKDSFPCMASRINANVKFDFKCCG